MRLVKDRKRNVELSKAGHLVRARWQGRKNSAFGETDKEAIEALRFFDKLVHDGAIKQQAIKAEDEYASRRRA